MTKHQKIAEPFTVEEELKTNHFRVNIFGSSRIKKDDKQYKQIFALAREIARHNIDIVTGGGPGMMEAANSGHHAGRNNENCHSIGITIQLPFLEKVNEHLDVRKDFTRFSDRLDQFMALSDVVVVTPGGIGTCLELFYTWQLTQVKFMLDMPIILMGDMWADLIEWVQTYPLRKGLINPGDLSNIYVVQNNDEALEIILKRFYVFEKQGGRFSAGAQEYIFENQSLPSDE